MAEAKKSAAWDKRGVPDTTLRRGELPGYDRGSGTPAYIKGAASRAEGLSKSMVKDFGGKTSEPRAHRVSDGHYSVGAPPTKKEADAKPGMPGGQSGKR